MATTTALEKEWKELGDYQEKQATQMTISVARCYSNKNRYPDLLPFDSSRVVLEARRGNDDYINATFLGKLCDQDQPNFIIAQAPLASNPNELFEFWSMVVQQQVELLICLCRDSELTTHNKSIIYWPTEKQSPLIVQSLRIVLVSVKQTSSSIQRVCTVENKAENLMRTVTVLQHVGPGDAPAIGPHELPENIPSFLKFIKECEHFYKTEQRNSAHPVLVSCMSGVSRSALFLVVYTAINIIESYNDSPPRPIIPSDCLTKVVKLMRIKRKYMVQSMQHLKYAYDAVLYYLKDALIKEGVLTNCSLNQVEAAVGHVELKPNMSSAIEEKQKTSEQTNSSLVETAPAESTEKKKPIESIIDLCDPFKFTLESNQDASRKKNKITKNDFINYTPGMKKQFSSDDPFGSLDPLAK